MKIFGMVLMIIGGIFFYGTKIAISRNKKRIDNEKIDSSDLEYVNLINNALYAIRAIGTIMVIAGGIVIIFTK